MMLMKFDSELASRLRTRRMFARIQLNRQTRCRPRCAVPANRLQTLSGGNTNGLGLRVVNYTDNTLNQVTGRDVARFVRVLGASILANAVTVNGQAPLRLARPVMLAQQQPPMNQNIPTDPNPMQQTPQKTFQTP